MCMLSSACRLSLFSWFEHILFGIDYTIGSGTSHVKRLSCESLTQNLHHYGKNDNIKGYNIMPSMKLY